VSENSFFLALGGPVEQLCATGGTLRFHRTSIEILCSSGLPKSQHNSSPAYKHLLTYLLI